MPRLRRLVPALVAGVIALTLSGCVPAAPAPAFPTSGPESDPTGAAAAAVVQRADHGYAGARVVEDQAAEALTIVPDHPNGALVVFVHGWGQTRWAVLERRGESDVAHSLVARGFTVLAADGDLKAWGNSASVADYRGLIDDAMSRHHLDRVLIMGESMGGLATMQLAREVPEVRAVVAWYPVCDLRTMTQPRFQASIDDAWAGRDRAAVSPVRVGDTPMMVWASPQDTVVEASRNAAVCVAEGRAAGADVTYVRSSGQHGAPSNFDPATVVSFFERAAGVDDAPVLAAAR
ncbi:alpha/beta hydrolase family protein [Amnibacterium endophyticum]|uniref:Alpha/beta hydrolase family protein n=1 Tax=Amnibacterium endophyticum TaxID=2109337 RepID=A0ABW4LEN0_9MICO